MNEGRLGVVKRQENSNRKYMVIMNDVAKYRKDALKHYFDQEKKEELQRNDRSAGRVRKKAVQSMVLGKCLKMSREDTLTSPTGNLFGHYNGRPIASFSSDVEKYIASKDPKVRKEREMDFLMKKYKETGKILEEDQMKNKVKHYFQSRWGVHYKSEEKNKGESEIVDKPQIRFKDDKLPDIFSFYKTNMQTRVKGRAAERRMSRIEIRDESGQFVPLDSSNTSKGRRRSMFPSVDNSPRRQSTIRRPSQLPQMSMQQSSRRRSELTQFPSQTLRKRSMLPPIS
ncbi:unnamed protein product [Mytilus coruscus]|uniref:Uncharacterized protein n=1 Tax=Mytilus coruscus TaxID=42192 RepID=A0A6J8EGX6_MYTCO|nr:unnamed protein product [Mytilus coruscus]